MMHGHFEGKGLGDPALRALFTRESLVSSSWYAERLAARQKLEVQQWYRTARYLEAFLAKPNYAAESERLGVKVRLEHAWEAYHAAKAPEFIERLKGTLGAEPSLVP
jgi:hypothetical protein